MVIFNKEYFLDNNLKIYLLQNFKKTFIMYSKQEFTIFFFEKYYKMIERKWTFRNKQIEFVLI